MSVQLVYHAYFSWSYICNQQHNSMTSFSVTEWMLILHSECSCSEGALRGNAQRECSEGMLRGNAQKECSEGMPILKSDDSEENSASSQKIQISKLLTIKKGTWGLEGQNEEVSPIWPQGRKFWHKKKHWYIQQNYCTFLLSLDRVYWCDRVRHCTAICLTVLLNKCWTLLIFNSAWVALEQILSICHLKDWVWSNIIPKFLICSAG